MADQAAAHHIMAVEGDITALDDACLAAFGRDSVRALHAAPR